MFDTKYNAHIKEETIKQIWSQENNNLYNWNQEIDRNKSFIIDAPPPTISGILHMGHVFSYCQKDFIARYNRMQGKNVFYSLGFDNNGLPTERLVEKIKSDELKQKIKGIDMAKDGRIEEFRQMCNDVIEKSTEDYKNLFQTLGLSCDWSQSFSTISENSIKIAQMSFLDLKQKGLIEQRHSPVYWCPVDQTALAQADLEEKECKGFGYDIIFKTENNDDLIIYTTRPELLESCIAIFYNPNDERYSKLKESFAKVPCYNFEVPILSDLDVKIEKGTGLVMCCSYGDIQDTIWIRRHNLKSKKLISKDGKINNKTIEEAKKEIVDKLIKERLLLSTKEVIQIIKIAERSKAQIEIIETNQWYLKILDFKEDLLFLANLLNFHPENMKNRLIQWIEGLNQDWCISRDRFSGVYIPKDDNIVPYIPNNFKDGMQVFDTWFTSALTPQLNAKAINNEYYLDKERFSKLLPTDLRTQGHEIIRTWAFYTLIKFYLHNLSKEDLEDRQNNKNSIKDWLCSRFGNEDILKKKFLPWTDVMISGWCLAKDGTKMSKSKGNVISPLELIKEKNVDIIRYWSASSALGIDTAYNETKFIDGKKLLNKLWNATSFIANNWKISNKEEKLFIDFNIENVNQEMDYWIINKLSNILEQYHKFFQNFEYSKAKDTIERFFWNDFCDNYLEICKIRTYGLDANIYENIVLSKKEKTNIIKQQRSAIVTLQYCIMKILQALAPFIPFITEEIWKELGNPDSIHIKDSFSKINNIIFDKKLIKNADFAINMISIIRRLKSEAQVSIKAEIKKLICPKIPNDIKMDILNTINANNAEIVVGNQITVEF